MFDVVLFILAYTLCIQIYGCFKKQGYPKMHSLSWKTLLKWMILGGNSLFSETSIYTYLYTSYKWPFQYTLLPRTVSTVQTPGWCLAFRRLTQLHCLGPSNHWPVLKGGEKKNHDWFLDSARPDPETLRSSLCPHLFVLVLDISKSCW